jgi:DNA repair protein RadC
MCSGIVTDRNVSMRWHKATGRLTRSDDTWRPAELLPATAVPGFAEAVARTAGTIGEVERMAPPPPNAYDEVEFADPVTGHEPVFPSEGPHGHRERMRDRLLDRGPDGLADYELLEMLLFLVQAKGDTKPLAKRLINRFGSYANTLAARQDELLAISGVGRFTVAALKLVHGSAIRLARAEVLDQPVLGNWEQLMTYLNAVMARERVEQFRILFLDTRNRLIADELQGRGTINHTPVYVREVAKRALELHAASVILTHNHPSGDPTPSMADLDMTTEIQRVLKSLAVAVHDHVIVGNGKWISLRKEGFL